MHYQKDWDNMSICLTVSTWGGKVLWAGVSLSLSHAWKNSHSCGVRCIEQVRGEAKKPWRLKCNVLKVRFSGKWQSTRSRTPVQSQLNKAQHCQPIYVILGYINGPQSTALIIKSFISGSWKRFEARQYVNRWIDEVTLWRLKTEYCIIRWLCEGSAVSSHCHTDWLKARSDDEAARSERRRIYPLALRWNIGQWPWVHREGIHKHLLGSCFTLMQSFLPVIHDQYKHHLDLMVWTLGQENVKDLKAQQVEAEFSVR